MKIKGRPPGTPKTGGRKLGTGGRRLYLTIPKAQAESFQNYTDEELRKLITSLLKKEVSTNECLTKKNLQQ